MPKHRHDPRCLYAFADYFFGAGGAAALAGAGVFDVGGTGVTASAPGPSTMWNSTRRLFARPASVSLLSIGRSCPKPALSKRLRSIPALTRASTTAAARRRLSSLLRAAIADGVGVSLDAQLLDLGVLLHEASHVVDDVLALTEDLGRSGLELDLLGDADLTGLDADGRTAVLLRVVVARSLVIGARVFRVGDAVAVAIGRAAVLLRIVARHTHHVGAGVDCVGDCRRRHDRAGQPFLVASALATPAVSGHASIASGMPS